MYVITTRCALACVQAPLLAIAPAGLRRLKECVAPWALSARRIQMTVRVCPRVMLRTV